eukprot:SAG22_NODE_2363_length_2655_cov_2.789906_4_plen_83_part_00
MPAACHSDLEASFLTALVLVCRGLPLCLSHSDLVLVRDPEFRKACVAFTDYDTFAKEFTDSFKKLTELGFAGAAAPWWKFWA